MLFLSCNTSKVRELLTGGPMKDRVVQGLQYVSERNPGIKILVSVAAMVARSGSTIQEEIRPLDIPAFSYAPLTSVDVEHTFSAYKLALYNKCWGFTLGNLETMLVMYCF